MIKPYKLKNGTELDVTEMINIRNYYEASLTAEYLIENGHMSDYKAALEAGYEIRRQMDKYGYEEDEAVKEVLGECEEER